MTQTDLDPIITFLLSDPAASPEGPDRRSFLQTSGSLALGTLIPFDAPAKIAAVSATGGISGAAASTSAAASIFSMPMVRSFIAAATASQIGGFAPEAAVTRSENEVIERYWALIRQEPDATIDGFYQAVEVWGENYFEHKKKELAVCRHIFRALDPANEAVSVQDRQAMERFLNEYCQLEIARQQAGIRKIEEKISKGDLLIFPRAVVDEMYASDTTPEKAFMVQEELDNNKEKWQKRWGAVEHFTYKDFLKLMHEGEKTADYTIDYEITEGSASNQMHTAIRNEFKVIDTNFYKLMCKLASQLTGGKLNENDVHSFVKTMQKLTSEETLLPRNWQGKTEFSRDDSKDDARLAYELSTDHDPEIKLGSEREKHPLTNAEFTRETDIFWNNTAPRKSIRQEMRAAFLKQIPIPPLEQTTKESEPKDSENEEKKHTKRIKKIRKKKLSDGHGRWDNDFDRGF